jgi:hypothetical protein
VNLISVKKLVFDTRNRSVLEIVCKIIKRETQFHVARHTYSPVATTSRRRTATAGKNLHDDPIFFGFRLLFDNKRMTC